MRKTMRINFSRQTETKRWYEGDRTLSITTVTVNLGANLVRTVSTDRRQYPSANAYKMPQVRSHTFL